MRTGVKARKAKSDWVRHRSRFDPLMQPDVLANLGNKKQLLLPSGQMYFSVLLGPSHLCSGPYKL